MGVLLRPSPAQHNVAQHAWGSRGLRLLGVRPDWRCHNLVPLLIGAALVSLSNCALCLALAHPCRRLGFQPGIDALQPITQYVPS